MTAIALPATPLPLSASPRPIIFGGWQTPLLGGVEQFLQRLGNRWALDIVTARLIPEPDASLWTTALTSALMDGARVSFRWPQPGLVVPAVGAPLVDGAGQNGAVLNIRALGAMPSVRGFFSLISGGRRYLHRITAVTPVSSSRATLAITPLLRVVPADGDTLEFTTPMIEGKVIGNGWKMVPARVESLSFSIVETA